MKEQVDAVRQMQEYIDEHLYDTITPADLANASHYSPWHAYRLFTQCLGRTPWEYIRRFRLARSALQLRDESITVTDAAFRCGSFLRSGRLVVLFRRPYYVPRAADL